ncbi:MAG: cobalamin-binding protein [Dehalococcoidia bacterium]|nr:cobalamin-binding protein [Dehalococcoidia bacterium]
MEKGLFSNKLTLRRFNIWPLLFIFILASLIACTTPATSIQTSVAPQAENTSSALAPTSTQQSDKEQAATESIPEYPLTVTDDLGRKVTINKLPERIVSLAPSNTEILFALSLDDKIIGVTDYCDYPEAAKTKTRVAGYSTPDLERLVSLHPDLIVAESIQEKTVLPALERLGMTVFVAEATTIDSILNHISVLGKITAKSTIASKLVDDMNSEINSIASKTKNLSGTERLRVLYVNWDDPIWTMGRNTFVNDIIKIAGGINIYDADFEKSRAVSLESVITKNPQVIFVSGMGTTGDAVLNGIKDEVRLYSVDAMKNNRIYKISNADLIERPGPRIVEGLAEVAKMIHPEIFCDLK